MQSSYFEVPTPAGKLWGVHNHGPEGPWRRPVIVICPGYEKRAVDSLGLSVHMVANGLETIRFDASNAPGLSTGTITSFTLSSSIADIHAIVGHVRREGGQELGLGCLAVSLSARSLIRYAAEAAAAAGMGAVAMVVGVVCVEHTVSCIVGHNAFRSYRDKGSRYGVRKLLHYEIDWDNFVADAWDHDLVDLEGTLADVRTCRVPRFLSIVTEDDEWVPHEHSDAFHAAFEGCAVSRYVIEGATHKLWKNPRSMDVAAGCLVRFFHEALSGAVPAHVVSPPITEIVTYNHAEQQKLLEIEMSRT
jgi:hypothetical protein